MSIPLTELTTAITDAVLAVECILAVVLLRRSGTVDHRRTGLWTTILGLTACVSVLGAVTHGLALPALVADVLWRALYLSLGIIIALFVVAAVYDWKGWALARRLVPWGLLAGLGFFALTEIMGGDFLVFVIYEAAGMLTALTIYAFLALTRRLEGAGMIALSILTGLMAAAVQASDLWIWHGMPFDHNGLFHLVQMMSIALLMIGLLPGMKVTIESVKV